MKTNFVQDGEQAWFIVTDVDPDLHQAVKHLGYEATPWGGYGRSYPVDTPDIEAIYANFAASAEALILQKAGRMDVPWKSALEAFLVRVAPYPIRWWMTGSTALAIRGIPIEPGDIDIVAFTADDGIRLDQLFQDKITEPTHSDWIAHRLTRTFLGARVGWIADLNECNAEQAGLLEAGRRVESVLWHGYTVLVPPPMLQLQMNERRGRTNRVQYIREWLSQQDNGQSLHRA